MTHVLSLATFFVAALLYGAASVLFFFAVARKNLRPAPESNLRSSARVEPAEAHRFSPLLLATAALAHLAYVTFASLVARVCPVNSVHFSLSFAAILAVAVYLVA